MNTHPTPVSDLIVEQFRAGEDHSVVGLILTLRDLELKLAAMTVQRDRLTEALRECRDDSIELLSERDSWQRESRGDYQERYHATRDNVTRADEALQSLTTNES